MQKLEFKDKEGSCHPSQSRSVCLISSKHWKRKMEIPNASYIFPLLKMITTFSNGFSTIFVSKGNSYIKDW